MEKWRIPKKVLKENCKEYQFEPAYLDSATIPLCELDTHLWNSLEVLDVSNIERPVFNFNPGLVEGLIQTYPAKVMKDYLLKTFPEIKPGQVWISDIPEGGQKVQIKGLVLLLPDVGKNIERISNWMKVGGYTLVAHTEQAFKVENLPEKDREKYRDLENQRWVTLYFSPDFQKPRNMDDELHLWHISPKVLEKSILEKGFVPYSKNSKFKYPDRIYFFRGSLSKDIVIREGIKLYKTRLEGASKEYKEHVDMPKYVLYDIALYRMSGYKFYTDPDWFDLAVYTTQNIPPSVIESREDIDYTNI